MQKNSALKLTVTTLSIFTVVTFALPVFCQARSWTQAGSAYISMAAFSSGLSEIEHNLKILLDSPTKYGFKCIENFSEYSSDLIAARKQLKKLKPEVNKFYSGDANEADLDQLVSDLEEYGESVSAIESTQESSPIKFVMSDECVTPTQTHAENAYYLFWKSVPEDLRNLHSLVANDLKKIPK